MNETEELGQGRELLHAVERILDDTENIIALVHDVKRSTVFPDDTDEETARRLVARRLIERYSTRTAISGGLSALPAVVPGVGTAVAVVGGSLADMGLLLKFEVELALALTWLYGYDIRREKERQIAFLLASVGTYNVKSGRNFFQDAAEAELTAAWNYTPRQVSKVLLTVLSHLALLNLSKGLVRALPFLGMAISGATNKVLTSRIGERCRYDLEQRRRFEPPPALDADDGEAVEARVTP